MQNDDAQRLARKIAVLITAETADTDLASLRESIDAIGRRLETLEAAISYPKSEISNLQFPHPSQDHFAIAEAIADGLFDKNIKEKACAFEPNGKPCDHCSMCNSRGF